jgi:hypothetical protein
MVRVDLVVLRDGRVEREQPGRRRVDRHRGVHLVEGDAGEQHLHVLDVRDRDADLADLAAGEWVIGVVAGLGRQIEGDRQTRLALGQIRAIERVAGARGAVPRVGPEYPRPLPVGRTVGIGTAHSAGSPAGTTGKP